MIPLCVSAEAQNRAVVYEVAKNILFSGATFYKLNQVRYDSISGSMVDKEPRSTVLFAARSIICRNIYR